MFIKLNKAGHFEGSFFWKGRHFDPIPPLHFKKNLSNINILYTIVKARNTNAFFRNILEI